MEGVGWLIPGDMKPTAQGKTRVIDRLSGMA